MKILLILWWRFNLLLVLLWSLSYEWIPQKQGQRGWIRRQCRPLMNSINRIDRSIGLEPYAYRDHWNDTPQKTIRWAFVCTLCCWMEARCRRWDSFRVLFVVFSPNWNHSMFENPPNPQWSNFRGWIRGQHFPWQKFDGNPSMFFSQCPYWLGHTTSYNSGYWWCNDIGPILASIADLGVEGADFHN